MAGGYTVRKETIISDGQEMTLLILQPAAAASWPWPLPPI